MTANETRFTGLFTMVMFSATTPAQTTTGVVTGKADLADEGVAWIRGQHEVDSEAAQALLASYAIVRGGK